jgi:signal transduction histidine kinase
MAQLIDELLNLAIIESGGNEPNLQLTELGQIFQTASMSVRGSAEAKSVQIIVTLDPSLAPLPLDPLKIEQTVVNLLSNAVEHTRSGTAVRLAARHEPNHVIVSVSDQGPGVPPAMLDRLFQPFARWQGQKTPGHTSHGLGLAIAKRMVDAHQGRIWLEANSNQGATFSFSLPIHRGSL